jgi:LuxR family maltose regulon positive regulatory protein
MLHTGRAAAAIPLVRKQLRDALTRQRNFRALKLRLFLACALRETGDQRGAMRHLRSALQFAASEGFVSAFRSEGLLVTRLLRELHESPAHSAADRVSAEFLRQVEFPTLPTPLQSAVTADRKASTQDRQASLKLGLTFSEARVLKLLSKGLSNRELASQLLVSERTVKTHLARINVKLGARRRAEAIAAARQLQIID